MSSDSAARPVGRDQPASFSLDHCPECDGVLRVDCGETYCIECGLVVDVYRIDHGPEWSSYNADERRRTGGPLTETRHDRGISTDIGFNTDGYGNALPNGKRRQFHRLRREHGRSRFGSKGERNLGHGFEEIRRIVGALELSETVTERACSIFRKASTEDLLRGRSIESMAAASVFAACRCQGLPRRVEEVCDYARVECERVKTAYRSLKRELGLRTIPTRPQDIVPRIASAVDAPDEIRCRAMELATCAEQTGLASGRKPTGVAAASLYHAASECGFPLTRGTGFTQTAIAEVAGVSAVTLRDCWNDLQEMCEE